MLGVYLVATFGHEWVFIYHDIYYVAIRYAWIYVDSLWCPWSHKSIVTISFVMRWQCNMCCKVYNAVYYFTPRGFSKDSWVKNDCWLQHDPDRNVHGANMGPISGRQYPGGSHFSPMNFAIWRYLYQHAKCDCNAKGRSCLLTTHILHSMKTTSSKRVDTFILFIHKLSLICWMISLKQFRKNDVFLLSPSVFIML